MAGWATSRLIYLRPMKRTAYFFLTLLYASIGYPTFCYSQRPEPQKPFVREGKPHAYYITQAKLWLKELQKDKTSESNWYNYYYACRNAAISAKPGTDVLAESTSVKSGPEILDSMAIAIPTTSTYYFLKFLDAGIDIENARYLLKAYAMNPNLQGIDPSVISLAVCLMDDSLRIQANKAWYQKKEISDVLLSYAYNVLMSMDSNAIYFTQGDNAFLPLVMLQDVKGIRTDVTVVAIDFLWIEDYRAYIFSLLKLDSLDWSQIDRSQNSTWMMLPRYCLTHYNTTTAHPLYLDGLADGALLDEFEGKLYPSGITLHYTPVPPDTNTVMERNSMLFERKFDFTYLRHGIEKASTYNQDYIGCYNYLDLFTQLYHYYKTTQKLKQAADVKALTAKIIRWLDKPSYTRYFKENFK